MNPLLQNRVEKPALLFPGGLPGLERYRRFTAVPVPDNQFFLLLQSGEEPDLGLLLVDPFPFFPDYSCPLSDLDRQDLELERRGDLLIYTTVRVFPEGFCTNLAAPLAINAVARLGKQLYLHRYAGRMRAPLIDRSPALMAAGEAAPGSGSLCSHNMD